MAVVAVEKVGMPSLLNPYRNRAGLGGMPVVLVEMQEVRATILVVCLEVMVELAGVVALVLVGEAVVLVDLVILVVSILGMEELVAQVVLVEVVAVVEQV